MRRRLCCVVLLLVFLSPALAAAQDSSAPVGLYFEPSFFISTFVTDKGELTREAEAIDERETLNVHTGGLNWVLSPSLAVGWAWGNWLAAMRVSYPVHLVSLNLPYGETASGTFQSLEAGPEFAYRLFDFSWTTVEAQVGAALRFVNQGYLEYDYSSGGAANDRRDFGAESAMSGFAVHLGAGGDLMEGERVLLGWMFRFYWGRYELQSYDDVLGAGSGLTVYDEEHLSMNVYSAFLGLRLRIGIPLGGGE